MSYLRISALKKTYGATSVLKGVSLEIGTGEFVSLLGPSGSGKTTILRCVAGLEMPDAASGEVVLGSKKLSGPSTFVPPEERNLGMVFQNYAVWPHMSVLENVAFPLRIQAKKAPRNADGKSVPASKITRKAMEALDLVKLSGLEKRLPHELSGGQQQRVALARALAMSPDLLLLDEPLSNLDALLREELGVEIRRLQRSLNLTTILVTHDQKEALSLSDRIVLLNHGEIDTQGSPEELYSSPPTTFSSEFLSGAQRLKLATGESRLFLPRRWSNDGQASGDSCFPAKILSRIYLGSEYEYWAQADSIAEPVRFFSRTRHEMAEVVGLRYQ